MTKEFCDKCERDITLDNRYILQVTRPVNVYALPIMVLCGFCKEALKAWLEE